jgi:hypothetical protein
MPNELDLLPLVIGTIISLASAGAVIYNSRTQAKAFKGNIILNLTDSFSSQEMNDAMKSLKDMEQSIKSLDLNNLPPSKTVFDQKRRMITHHFFKIYLLRKSGVIDNKILKTVAQEEDVEYLIKYVEPLETAINKNYNREMFDFYHDILDSGFYQS